MLNAGVIGLGVGEKHALAYQRHKKVKLKSMYDFDTKKANELKAKFPNVSIASSAQSILKNEEIDIVSIASYDNYHSDQIIEAFKNEKHVMAEKPLCLSINEMIDIYTIQSKNKKLKLSANHVLRSTSRFIKLKKDISTGKFGDVYYIEGDYYWGRKQKLFGWRAEMDFYSIILGAAIHMIDLVMWIIDSIPVSVQAMGNNIPNRNSKLKYNSFVVILLEFKNGSIVKLTGNGGCIHPHFHGLKIFGTNGTAIQNLDGANYIDSYESNFKFDPIIETYPEKETREKVIHSFVNNILDPSIMPIVSEKDVYNVMSVCFAAEKAMNTGNSVSIKYITS